MRFLTKPVRNLLLATVFGTAMVLVETEPVQATYPDCPDVALPCILSHQNHVFVIDDEAQECYFGYVTESWMCVHMVSETSGIIEDGGLCFARNPSGGYEYCDE